MKKIILLFFAFSLVSCNDGDFSIPSFAFQDIEIANCGNVVFYKISDSKKEGLILQLGISNENDTIFRTPMTNKSYALSDGSQHNIRYRIFNDLLSDSYFCQNIPPSCPSVSKEWL